MIYSDFVHTHNTIKSSKMQIHQGYFYITQTASSLAQESRNIVTLRMEISIYVQEMLKNGTDSKINKIYISTHVAYYILCLYRHIHKQRVGKYKIFSLISKTMT